MARDETFCDTKVLGRFFDRELALDEDAGMREHVEHCRPCAGELRDNEFISGLLRVGVQEEVSRANLQEVEEKVLTLIRTKQGRWWWVQLKNLCLSKKFYVPAAAMAAILIIVLHLAPTRPTASGPSAIINSLQGNYASVMILETQKTRQTILWIHETSDLWDNEGGPTDQTRLGPSSTKYCLTLETGQPLRTRGPLSTV